ncbi:MAG: hypothetical protein KGL55_05070 [Rhodospirillales bacterium]|nr:hypothetical protein [Rhodospirillales bacterium]
MRKAAGQAARHAGVLLHRLAVIAIAVVVLAGFGAGVLAWRLAQGPLSLGFLRSRLEQAANDAAAPAHVTIGRSSLAWEGFRGGVDRPLDLRLDDVTVVDAGGAADGKGGALLHLREARVSLSLLRLLVGRLAPRAIELDGASLSLLRGADGALRLDLGPGAADAPPLRPLLAAVLGTLARPPQGDGGAHAAPWAQLRRLRLRDASAHLADRRLGLDWRVPRIDVDLRRAAAGGLTGTGRLALAVAGQTAELTVRAAMPPGAGAPSVSAELSAINPASLAGAAPALAPLARLDAAVSVSARATFSRALDLARARVVAHAGAGSIGIDDGHVALQDGAVDVTVTPGGVDARLLHLAVAPSAGGPVSALRGRLIASRAAGAISGTLDLDLDQVAFADLPRFWPLAVGRNGLRPWVIGNITGGTASGGHVALGFTTDDTLASLRVTSLAGGIDGHDLTVHWLRPVPPIIKGEARLEFRGPDALDIAVSAGRQSGAADGGLAITAGRVGITGLSVHDQFADIDGDLAGSLADLIAVLREKRVGLLARRPIPLGNPAGTLAGHLAITQLPLKRDLSLDDVHLATSAHLTGVHLGGIAAGHDLDHGVLDLTAGNDGLAVKGHGELAGIAAQLDVAMDFRDGPPGEVLQTVAVTARPDAAQLAAIGLDGGSFLRGPVDVAATMRTRRDGRGDIALKADLAAARLDAGRLGWRKEAGAPATASAQVQLQGERVTAIDALHVAGSGLTLDGRLAFAAGRPSALTLSRLVLGGDTDVSATIGWPARPGAPWRITVHGASLDATAEFARTPPSAAGKPPAARPPARGPAWAVEAHLARVVLGRQRVLRDVSLRADSDGLITSDASLTGRTEAVAGGRLTGSAGFDLRITPQAGGRVLTGHAVDAGALLNDLGVIREMRGGALTLSGRYDDSTALHRLSGSAEISSFRIQNAPAMVRLLEAMTLYGLVGMVQGPGLGFDRLIAPFQLTGDTLELQDARAFSTALGMTARGTINLAGGACDLHGTIVPAYFFNSLLGGIPFIGRIFSPEPGGGLFAATYSLRGPCDDPQVGVNPLAALTPGFLRGVFGIFDGPGGPAPPAARTDTGGSK